MFHVPFKRILILAGLAACLAVPALAQERSAPRPQRGYPPGRPEARLIEENAKELGVSDEVMAKIKKIADAARVEDEKAADQIREAWDELNTMLHEPLPDEKKLLAQADAISGLSIGFQKRRLSVTHQVRSLLSAEQLEKYMKLRSETRRPRPPGIGGIPPGRRPN